MLKHELNRNAKQALFWDCKISQASAAWGIAWSNEMKGRRLHLPFRSSVITANKADARRKWDKQYKGEELNQQMVCIVEVGSGHD